MMSFGTKAAFSIPKTNLFQLQVALFHSSPVLERKRRNFCDASHRSRNRSSNYSRRSRRLNANEALLRNIGAYADHLFQSYRSNNYSRRSSRLNAKEVLLHNIGSYADHLFQRWHDGFDEEVPSSSSGPSWFRQQYSKGSRKDMNDNRRTTSWGKKGFHFCEEDNADGDNIFRSTFGGNRYFYWSFVSDENPQWKSSSDYHSYSYGKNWRYRVEEDYDCSSESDSDDLESNIASDRLALGLRAHGPLKLEDVKNAYRSCALKWHPDRHQGSSKAVAEEKFKLCSAAYQSLCDKLTAA
uniref:J domain-containing protein n=1 Tax=Populus davidiana TaxID=266767 RepID=A0A6M2EUA5_9ROSI